jgi:glycosyltransferase involved in cell wall biosynthesis
MKKISIVTPCFNEEINVELIYSKVKEQFDLFLFEYDYEHLFIDNASTDGTVKILKSIASRDDRVKLILNARNFGPVKSPYYGLLQADGDAVMLIVADLQDPPELIPKFVNAWKNGSNVVVGVKPSSKESKFMFLIRRIYYKLLKSISDIDMIENYTGFGIYDKSIIDEIKNYNEPYPFFRGLVCEVASGIHVIEYVQPARINGKSKYKFYDLYDVAISGLTAHSKLPLRLATFAGFLVGVISFVLAFVYFVLKLLYWDEFPFGLAPLLIGLFLFGAIQLVCIGMLGEYLLSILNYSKNRPLVKERERVNFK